ncbi:hypothetical protein H8B06_19180 [Sphingobacterium sp. DN00404]|uniref:DUF92 domain-containing protein n=1 Tax=Sphingobacterium micropteri TaxID=2763501 RepID=A0ABR7YUI6_9SPHI|nr:hypothetical protein [Sphingobacterium micropteri]MBD1434952.1 hypothetical protein [Sphingobacterium micropteri]
MMILYILSIVGIALLSVTAIDALGAIASRKFRFNYGYFAILSFITYFFTGYYLSFVTSPNSVLLLCGMVGIFDGTIGFKIAKKLKPYAGKVNYDEIKHDYSIVLIIFFLAIIVGALGHAIA